MPIVSAWVMPAGLMALVAMPFGFDGPVWRLMGTGIDWMVAIAGWVTGLPGAVGRVAAFGTGPLLLGTAGLVTICLLRSRLRWAGAVLVAAAAGLAASPPRPDVLIAVNGDSVAVRERGRLSALRFGNDPFSIREWLGADADARKPDDPSLKQGFVCDAQGCVATLDDGARIAIARTAEAVAEDCARVHLLITTRDVPPACAAKVLDRTALRTQGSLSITHREQGWVIEAARPSTLDRPWARGARASQQEPATATRRPASRDATPAETDVDYSD
jgi:competence protein ComEC